MLNRVYSYLTVALLCAVFTSSTYAQSSAFTYQGSLSANGSPANGFFDITFGVWDDASAGLQVSGVLTNTAVSVVDGVFTVTLDFGAAVFDGSDRWLEISVVTNGGGAFSTLSPRQTITSAPYAMKALTAMTAASVLTPPGMVLVPAGEFTMGDTLDGSPGATPTVSATISAFYMDATEVTWSQWQSVYFWATNNGYGLAFGAGNGPNHPVHSVNWHDCVKWCNARSEQAGLTPVYYTDTNQTTVYRTGQISLSNQAVDWGANGYRLPTEAEWEKAARGGLAGQRFPWGKLINQNLANYVGDTSLAYDLGPDGYHPLGGYPNTQPGTTPVGTFAANGYGLRDMAGNVREWCWDWHGTPYAGGADPRGPTTGSARELRGGSWITIYVYCRVAQRYSYNPTTSDYNFGFRCVRPPGQ